MKPLSLALVVLCACPGAEDTVVDTDAGLDTDTEAPEGPYTVFVTSITFLGDLQTAGGGATGLDGADALCQTAADAAGLSGTYAAWLGDSTTDAIDRFADGGPWLNTQGETVFNNSANLRTTPLVPVTYDENGVDVLSSGNRAIRYWSGSEVGGRTTPDTHCQDWTEGRFTGSDDQRGRSGFATQSDDRWTSEGSYACNFDHRLLCLQR